MHRIFRKIAKKCLRLMIRLDKKAFGGKLFPGLYSYLESMRYEFTDEKKIRVATNELFWMQYNNPHVAYRMQRYDIPNKYHECKNGKIHAITNRIVVDQEYFIVEGEDLLVQAICEHNEWVDITMMNMPESQRLANHRNIKYREDFQDIAEELDSDLQELMAMNTKPFILVLWHPAKHIWDNVIESINQYEPKNMQVRDYFDLQLSESELLAYMKVLYYYNTTNLDAIRWKTKIFTEGKPYNAFYDIRVVTVDVFNPFYVVDKDTDKIVSDYITSAKRHLRLLLKHRMENYIFDNIFHSADCWQESSFFENVLTINRDLSGLFDGLGSKAALIKRTKSYNPSTEPILRNLLEFNTELDLLTSDKELESVYAIVMDFAKNKYERGDIEVHEVVKEKFNGGKQYNRFIEVTCRGFIIYMFHVQTRLYSLKKEFLKMALQNARMDGVQRVIDSPNYEIYMRLAELECHPEKNHHVEYVKYHHGVLSDSDIRESFEEKSVKRILQLAYKING